MKFYDAIGYSVTVDRGNGVWEPQVTERHYFGDVTRNTKRTENGESINDNVTLNHTISVIADAFAYQNFSAIQYARWMGVCWKVNSVEVQPPRLILTIGGVYNGQTC